MRWGIAWTFHDDIEPLVGNKVNRLIQTYVIWEMNYPMTKDINMTESKENIKDFVNMDSNEP